MAVGFLARIDRLEREMREVRGKVRTLEAARARIERSIRAVLDCLERNRRDQERFHNRTAQTLMDVISATRERS